MSKPDEDLTMSQRYEKLIDELYQDLDQCKENRDFLRERGEQDALLLAELKQTLRALHEWALLVVPHSYREGTAGKRIYSQVQELLQEKERR